jgi:hypothetical protein
MAEGLCLADEATRAVLERLQQSVLKAEVMVEHMKSMHARVAANFAKLLA